MRNLLKVRSIWIQHSFIQSYVCLLGQQQERWTLSEHAANFWKMWFFFCISCFDYSIYLGDPILTYSRNGKDLTCRLNSIHQISAQPSCLQVKLKPFSSNGSSAKLCHLLRKYIEVEFLEISSITHLSSITSDSCGLAFCLTCKTSLKREVSTADSSVSYLRFCMVCKQKKLLGVSFMPSAL